MFNPIVVIDFCAHFLVWVAPGVAFTLKYWFSCFYGGGQVAKRRGVRKFGASQKVERRFQNDFLNFE